MPLAAAKFGLIYRVMGAALSKPWKSSGRFFQGLEKPLVSFSNPWKGLRAEARVK
ncbi:MAG: hypothetical protein NTY53_06575 [Kiritimatiellaeota bacterium]|nr:hypothetical protein [Kiritimatiellota bacterium]